MDPQAPCRFSLRALTPDLSTFYTLSKKLHDVPLHADVALGSAFSLGATADRIGHEQVVVRVTETETSSSSSAESAKTTQVMEIRAPVGPAALIRADGTRRTTVGTTRVRVHAGDVIELDHNNKGALAFRVQERGVLSAGASFLKRFRGYGSGTLDYRGEVLGQRAASGAGAAKEPWWDVSFSDGSVSRMSQAVLVALVAHAPPLRWVPSSVDVPGVPRRRDCARCAPAPCLSRSRMRSATRRD